MNGNITERVLDLSKPSLRSAGGAAPNGEGCDLLIEWTA